MKPIIEICANSATSCLEAAKGGAYRVELCAGIPEGGTTPSIGETLAALKATRDYGLKVNVIIRPRGGDFLYSELEIEAMRGDIQALVSLGVDGVVLGCLTSEGMVDKKLCRELMEVAKMVNPQISFTFHRAFDVTDNAEEALETIISLGFDRILTSGQEINVVEGVEMLAKLVELAGDRIIIMPGCGVNEANIEELAQRTKATEFHLSARDRVESEMVYRNDRVSMGGTVTIEEFSNEVTSEERVAAIYQALERV